MSRTTLCLIALCTVALAASPAAAQKKAAPRAPAAESEPCTCPDAAPAAPIREGGLAECTDGVDNDRDGHLDCTDQDCEIYAACMRPTVAAEPPLPPPMEGKSYSNMRELKRDLHAGAISGRAFYHWQMTIRAWREAEFDLAKAEYRAGRITQAEYRARIAAIRLKYEG
ncbi:MAG: hypothetical protein M0R80_17855 [Proteobacteria bacterium]|jgi:hypothetical protein|nr:hypothetical protein [Pseudomonadota bacterium]